MVINAVEMAVWQKNLRSRQGGLAIALSASHSTWSYRQVTSCLASCHRVSGSRFPDRPESLVMVEYPSVKEDSMLEP
jgi:hypothetical protein